MEWVIETRYYNLLTDSRTKEGSRLLRAEMLVNRSGEWQARAINPVDGTQWGKTVDPTKPPHNSHWIVSILDNVIDGWSRTYLGMSVRWFGVSVNKEGPYVWRSPEGE